MKVDWQSAATSTHQDHVIAHVIGATVLGYFVFDETAFLLLDIGFIWHIYLDGEMGLRPHPVAISELEADRSTKSDLQRDVDAVLQQQGSSPGSLFRTLTDPAPIQSVDFLVYENSRRLVLTCEQGRIVIETSLDSSEVNVMTTEADHSESNATD